MPGERAEVAQAFLAQRSRAARQGQIQGADFVVQCGAQVQDRHTVACGGDQFTVCGEHLGVGVPDVAVRREGQQVDHAGAQPGEGALARRVVGQRLGDAPHPEVERVGHVGREIDEVDVVPDVVADQLADGLQRAHGGVDHRLLRQPRQMLQKVRRELEAHGHQRGVELPRCDTSLPGRPGGGRDAVRVPDDCGFETLEHPCMIPDPRRPTHSGFRTRRALVVLGALGLKVRAEARQHHGHHARTGRRRDVRCGREARRRDARPALRPLLLTPPRQEKGSLSGRQVVPGGGRAPSMK